MKRRARKMGKTLKGISKKYKLGKKARLVAPVIAGAALSGAGIIGGAMGGGPAAVAGGAVAGQLVRAAMSRKMSRSATTAAGKNPMNTAVDVRRNTPGPRPAHPRGAHVGRTKMVPR